MQDWNDIHLYIDADANSETGHPVHESEQNWIGVSDAEVDNFISWMV